MYLDAMIHVDGMRVFIDIAKKGCGNGCKYCYIETAETSQVLWEKEKISEALDKLELLNAFRADAEKFIISLCPSTEPLKSLKARGYILYIIKRLVHYKCFFQIATKDIVTTDFLEEVHKELLFEGQLIINISINNFTMASQIEPNAVTPEERLDNVDIIKKYKKIKSCVLIKPFLSLTYDDIEIFKEKLINHRPDHICVGIYFSNNHNVSEKDSVAYFDEHFERQNVIKICEFMHELSGFIGAKVFPSSLCVFNQYRKGFTVPNASKTELCARCEQCN